VPRLIVILFCVTKFEKPFAGMYGRLYMSTQLQTVRRGDLDAPSVRCSGVFERGMDWGHCKQEVEIKYIQWQYET
jgi:hypothetical protein